MEFCAKNHFLIAVFEVYVYVQN